MKKNVKFMLSIFSIFLVLFFTSNVYAYEDYAITVDVPGTVRAGTDFNIHVSITGTGTPAEINARNFDLNVYAPRGGDPIFEYVNSGPQTITFDIGGDLSDLNASAQPYLVRARLTESDNNPANNIHFKYFTVIRGQDRIPINDFPLYAGILIALIAVTIATRSSKKTKKW